MALERHSQCEKTPDWPINHNVWKAPMWVCVGEHSFPKGEGVKGQDKHSDRAGTHDVPLSEKHPRVEGSGSVTAFELCGFQPPEGAWELLPGMVCGGWLGLVVTTQRTLEDRAALTLRLACSVITSASVWLAVGLSWGGSSLTAGRAKGINWGKAGKDHEELGEGVALVM